MLITINSAIVFLYLFFSIGFENHSSMLREDSIVEYSGAILMFIASLFLIHLLITRFNHIGRLLKLFMVLYCLFLIVAAGEEISWGQRIFNIKTPDTISQYNLQNELNLHNLEIFNRRDREGDKKGIRLLLSAEMLYNIIALTLFLFIPFTKVLLYRFKPFKEIAELLPPKKYAISIILIFVVMKLCLIYFGNIQAPSINLQRGLGELKETLISIMFALYAFDIRRRYNLNTKT